MNNNYSIEEAINLAREGSVFVNSNNGSHYKLIVNKDTGYLIVTVNGLPTLNPPVNNWDMYND